MDGAVPMSSDSDYDKKMEAEKKEYGGFEKYEAEGFADTLRKASEILADPKKMKAANIFLDTGKAAIKTLDDIRNAKKNLKDDDTDTDDNDSSEDS